MPPKVRFTKEQIADKAYEIVRCKGMDSLTARSLAAELGTSTAPVFTAFKNIEDVQSAVKQKAIELYKQYIAEGMAQPIPFKGAGLKYVEFAKNEPMLFKLLFMDFDPADTVKGYHPGKSETADSVLSAVCNTYGIEEDKAKRLYNHLSVYTHGLAVMFALGNSMFTMEEVSMLLTELFNSLTGKGGVL